jgi:hypothetical protein
MLQGKELDDAILAAKAAVVPPIDYELLVFESPEKTAGKDDGDVFAFRRPSSSEWYRYRSEWLTEQPAVQAGAVKTLVTACRVYPSQVEFSKAIEERPGLVESIGGQLASYAGVERAKKVRRL